MNSSSNSTARAVWTIHWYVSARCWLAFGSTGLILNFIELFVLISKKKHHSVFGITVLSLCAADILACLSFTFGGSVRIAKYSGRLPVKILPNTTFYKIWKATNVFVVASVSASTLHIVVIAIQRLCSVFLPLKIRSVFTIKRCIAVLVAVWVFSITGGLLVHFSGYALVLGISCYLIATFAIIIALIYTAISIRICIKARDRRIMTNSDEGSSIRVVFHSILVTLAYSACSFPLAVYVLFLRKNLALYDIVTPLVCINHFMDPLIYFLLNNCNCRRPHRANGLARKDSLGERITIANVI